MFVVDFIQRFHMGHAVSPAESALTADSVDVDLGESEAAQRGGPRSVLPSVQPEAAHDARPAAQTTSAAPSTEQDLPDASGRRSAPALGRLLGGLMVIALIVCVVAAIAALRNAGAVAQQLAGSSPAVLAALVLSALVVLGCAAGMAWVQRRDGRQSQGVADQQRLEAERQE
ncbi:MAG: hypothetical protein JSR49_14940, partial [Proteobacteria bacterium]|nr:hypothetical protein [Pseudomonadota bacterium]